MTITGAAGSFGPSVREKEGTGMCMRTEFAVVEGREGGEGEREKKRGGIIRERKKRTRRSFTVQLRR